MKKIIVDFGEKVTHYVGDLKANNLNFTSAAPDVIVSDTAMMRMA